MRSRPTVLALLLTSLQPSAQASVQAPVEATPQAAVQLGERLPPLVLTDLRQSEAHSFSEFYGRAVLLEFFDYWSRPCVPVVTVLNQMQAQLGARGFSVVGVTREAARKTDAWIEKHGAKYAYGLDPTGALFRAFAVDETPLAVLVDAHGTVTWIGNPARLRPEELELALQGALEKPVWQWPAAARVLAGDLQKGEHAAALAKSAELGSVEGFDAPAFVRARIDALVARFDHLVVDGRLGEAFLFGRRLLHDLASLPEAERIAVRLDAWLADPASKSEIEAAQRLLGFERRRGQLRGAKQARELRDEVAAFSAEQAGRVLEPRARELLARLEHLLERVEDP